MVATTCGMVAGAAATAGAAVATGLGVSVAVGTVFAGRAGAGFDGATRGDVDKDCKESVWAPSVGGTIGSCGCCARAEMPYAEVSPNVAESAIPVDKMRAERAG
jgi:hypothetical protein